MSGLTLVEKILEADVGELVIRDVDTVMSHDTTTPLAIESFDRMYADRIWDPERAVIVFDHVIPAANIHSAQLQRKVREFVRQQGITNFYDAEGISHQILPEKGHVAPGNIIVGGDSHSCTYGAYGALGTGMGSTDIAVIWATGKNWFRVPETIRVNIEGDLPEGVTPKDLTLNICGELGADRATYKIIEYGGSTVEDFGMAQRMVLSNMAIEMGAKGGIIAADQTTRAYLQDRTNRPLMELHPDPGAQYVETIPFETRDLEPYVACPPSPDNVKPASELSGLAVDQVFIGTCTNGRLYDMKQVYDILRGKKVSVRTVIIPASREVYTQAADLGYIQEFMRAGAVVGNPGCGPCIGRHQGVLAPGQRCLSTMNRNFTGRMGSPEAEIYLASPMVAAATAIAGEITAPGAL